MNKIEINKYLELGYNRSQATSLAWADKFQDYMDSKSYQGHGFFSPEIRVDAYCFDCKKGGQFLPSTTRDFISMHKGHKTKTIKIRR